MCVCVCVCVHGTFREGEGVFTVILQLVCKICVARHTVKV